MLQRSYTATQAPSGARDKGPPGHIFHARPSASFIFTSTALFAPVVIAPAAAPLHRSDPGDFPPWRACSKNGKPTIEPLRPYVNIDNLGTTKTLSPLDIAALKKLYPRASCDTCLPLPSKYSYYNPAPGITANSCDEYCQITGYRGGQCAFPGSRDIRQCCACVR